jgi:hypothetical protein
MSNGSTPEHTTHAPQMQRRGTYHESAAVPVVLSKVDGKGATPSGETPSASQHASNPALHLPVDPNRTTEPVTGRG